MLNNNFKKILIKFGIWIGVGLATMIIGISNIFAQTIDVGDISGKTQVLADIPSASSGAPITLNRNVVNTYGSIYQLWFNVNNQSLLANTLYMFEIYTPQGKLSSNINWVGIQAENEVCEFVALLGLNGDYPKVYFKCRQAHTNGFTVLLNSTSTESITTSNFRWSYTYLRYFTDEENDIDWSAVTSNANQNANNIINNNNTNTQNIINNQNQNTQQQIESQKVCKDILIDKDNIILDNKYFSNINGTISNSNTDGITDYIDISSDDVLTGLAKYQYSYSCFYDELKVQISCFSNNFEVNSTISIPTNAKYVRFSIYKNQNIPRFNLHQCKNGNQALDDSIKEQTQTSKGILGKLKDLFDTLFSNDDADISGLDNMVGWLPPGPVDSIINLPLAFFNALTNTLTGTCQSVSLTIPFVNQTLTLPCFDAYMSQYLTGFNTLWTLVGTILSVFILYYYLLSLYKWVDDTLTFRENNLPGYYDDNWGGGA